MTENVFQKKQQSILDKFTDYLKNTSGEQFKKDWENVCKESEGVNSPTVDEYLEFLKKKQNGKEHT